MVVHWDGKHLPDLVGKIAVECIAVLVSYNGTYKFLGAPKLPSGTGQSIADAVYDLLVKWNLVDRIQGLSFDTTSTNTGIDNGAAYLLQEKIGRDLLFLPCRHHIYEIFLGNVFQKFIPSSAPEVPMFERFQKAWPTLNYESFQAGIEDENVRAQYTQSELNEINQYCSKQLTKPQIRDDYREFLQLALMFIGTDKFNFHIPGGISNARWMAKALYSLKIYLFRSQFNLSNIQKNGLRDTCIFLTRLYIKPWFECTNAVKAPLQDLEFVKDAIKYEKINSTISKAVLQKINNHLWYLSEETIALAFFDSNVSFQEKRNMVEKLKSPEPVLKLINGRNCSNLLQFPNLNLSDFRYKTLF